MKLIAAILALLIVHTISHPFSLSELAEKPIGEALTSFIDHILGHSVSNTSCTESCCASLKTRPAMTYHYYQNTGRFRGGSGDYAIDTHCYSGQGEGYNNPAKQCVQNVGPLPATTYKLDTCVNVMHETVQRPCSFYLAPQK